MIILGIPVMIPLLLSLSKITIVIMTILLVSILIMIIRLNMISNNRFIERVT